MSNETLSAVPTKLGIKLETGDMLRLWEDRFAVDRVAHIEASDGFPATAFVYLENGRCIQFNDDVEVTQVDGVWTCEGLERKKF